MGNSINNQFKMRRHGGALERATETSGTPYSEAQGRTMAQMGMVDNTAMNSGHTPTNYGTPIEYTGGKKPKDDFDYTPSTKGGGDLVLTPERENIETGGFTRGGQIPKPGDAGSGNYADSKIVSTDKFKGRGHGERTGNFIQEVNKARKAKKGEKYDKEGNVIS